MSEAQFDSLQQGEILVCQMTNPRWQVLYGKIIAVVTDAGGTVSHPAVTRPRVRHPRGRGYLRGHRSDQDQRRIRVNSNAGVVEILETAGVAAVEAWTEAKDRMSSATLISRAVLADAVDHLLEAILDGMLAGSRIVETRAAREFGTSRAPVRRRSATSRRSGSWRSPPSAAPVSGGRRWTICWRRTSSAGRSSRTSLSASRFPA